MALLHQVVSLAFHVHRPKLTRNVSIQSNNNVNDQGYSRWKQAPFDFSSKQGWEEFYKNGQITSPSREDDDNSSLEYEWHSHIPHSAIIDTIAPSIEAAANSSSNYGELPSILIVGCGNSSLPRVLHDAFDYPVRITCLDYSKVCIDMIRQMYNESCPRMDFVVGDAMKLREVISEHNTLNSGEEYHYDVVIDKGLMDALMCGEGFDVGNLQREVEKVLTCHPWGMHILICFPLITGTKDILNELGQENDGLNLFWRFDLPVEGCENGRASFNVGKRGLWKLDVEVVASETNWN